MTNHELAAIIAGAKLTPVKWDNLVPPCPCSPRGRELNRQGSFAAR